MKPRAFQIFLCVTLFCLASRHDACAQEVGAGLPLVPAEIPQNLRPIQLHSEDGANYFSGDYKYAIPLHGPVAKGIRPNLSLVYNSSLDRSGMGKGWAIDGMAHVKRSLRHGMPSYRGPGESPNEDEFEYQIGDEKGFLVYVHQSFQGLFRVFHYRPKTDYGSMLRFYYLSDHIWKVYDKNGTVWVLDQPDSSADGNQVFGWYVSEIEDAEGNKVTFSYEPAYPDTPPPLQTWSALGPPIMGSLPKAIKWDIGAYGPDPTDFLGPGLSPSIEFVWTDMKLLPEFQSPPPDVHHYENNYIESYQKGYRSDEGRKALDSIKITGYSETGSAYRHVHDVTYQPTQSFGSPSPGGPEIRGSWNVALFDPQDSSPATELPATKFEYWELPRGFNSVSTVDDPQPQGLVKGLGGLWYDQFSLATEGINKLIDMDGDGDLDILAIQSANYYYPGTGLPPGGLPYIWKWRENRSRDFLSLSEYRPVEMPPHCQTATPQNPEEAPGCFTHSLDYMIGFKDETVTDDTCLDRPTRKRWYQRVLDVTGDGAADLVYVKRLSKSWPWTFEVCRGSINASGERTFSFCGPWLVGQPSLKEEVDVFRHPDPDDSSCVSVNGTRAQHRSWVERDLLDMTGDGLPDFVEAKPGTADHAILAVWPNANQSFLYSGVTDIKVPYCDEIPPFTSWLGDVGDVACISSTLIDDWPRDNNDVEGDEGEGNVSCQTRALIDMNGDGVLDLVRLDPKTKTGRAFFAYHDVIRDVLAMDGQCVTEEEKEENGVTMEENGFRWFLGTGSSFENEPQPGPGGVSVLATRTQTPEAGYPNQEAEGLSHGALFDINGDRIPDLVQHLWGLASNAPGLAVKLGTGRSFGPQQIWSLCQEPCSFPQTYNAGLTRAVNADRCNAGYPQRVFNGLHITTRGFYDINGDGFVELIDIPDNAGNTCEDTPWKIYQVDRSTLGGNALIKKVARGSGSETEISYAVPNEYYTTVPFPKWVVSKLTYRDTITGVSRTEEITNAKGAFSAQEREFRGFGKVRVTDSEKLVIHYYLQGDFTKGYESKREIKDRSAFTPIDVEDLPTLKELEWNWEEHAIGDKPPPAGLPEPGPKWVRLVWATESLYTPAEEKHVTKKTTYKYRDDGGSRESCAYDWNSLGLVSETIYNDDLVRSEDRRVDEFDYTCNVTPDERSIVKPSRISRYDSSPTPKLLTESRYFYDEQCDDASKVPTRGKLCKESVWRGPGTGPADTSYQYDTLGRLEKTTLPDGEYTIAAYHDGGGKATPYVRSVTNNLNHQTYFKGYHPFTGIAGTECGPAYVSDPEHDKCDKTEFDSYGRPISIQKSQEEIDQRFGTVAMGEWHHVGRYSVPAGGQLIALLTPNNGNADLCVKQGSQWPTSSTDCACWSANVAASNEACVVPAAINAALPEQEFSVSIFGADSSANFDVKITTKLGGGSFPGDDPLVSWPPEVVTEIAYDDTGGPSDPPSVTVTNHPGGTDPTTKTSTYLNGSGMVLLDEKSHGSAGQSSKTYFLYDEFGRLQTAYRPALHNSTGYAAAEISGDHYAYRYDPLGRLESVTNPDNTSTTIRYEVVLGGNVKTTITDEESNETVLTRNRFDEVVEKSRRTAPAPAFEALVNTYKYDAAGRLHQAVDPEMGQYHFVFNPDGTLHDSWISDGASTTSYRRYTWTKGGKLSDVHFDFPLDIGSVSFEYDALGRLEHRHVDGGALPTGSGLSQDDSLFYDEASLYTGSLTRVVSTSREELPAQLQQGSVLGGDLATVPGSRNYERRFGYDARGAISHMYQRDLDDGQTLSLDIVNDVFGSPREIRYSDGTSVTYTRDASGSVRAVSSGGLQLAVGEMTYRADGHVATIKGSLGSLSFDRTFHYDAQGRLRDLLGLVGGQKWEIGIGYKSNGKVSWTTDDWRALQRTFDYDKAGRLTVASGYNRLGPLNTPNGIDGRIVYDYHRNDTLERVDYENGHYEIYNYTSPARQTLSSVATNYAGTWNYSDDSAGHLTGSSTATYDWCDDGTLCAVHYDDGITKVENFYSYTHDGERWKAVRNGDSTWYMDTLEYDSSKNELYRYVALPTILCRLGANSKCHFGDGHDYVATFGADGSLLEQKEFMPYGQENMLAGTTWDKIGFNDGKEQEPWFADGLYFMGARYYDRRLRQFLSVDPRRFGGAFDTIEGSNSLQPYAYAAADPISNFDPSGTQAEAVRQEVDFEVPPGQGEPIAVMPEPGQAEAEGLADVAIDPSIGLALGVLPELPGWKTREEILLEEMIKEKEDWYLRRRAQANVMSAEGKQMSQEQHDREVMGDRFVRELGVLKGLAPGAIWFGLSGFKDARGAELANAIFETFFAKGVAKAMGLTDKFLQVPAILPPPPPASLGFPRPK